LWQEFIEQYATVTTEFTLKQHSCNCSFRAD